MNARNQFMPQSREATATSDSLRLRKPPEPPKYLMTASPDGEVGFVKIKNVPPTVRPSGFADKPLATIKTTSLPIKTFDSPPHNFNNFRSEQKRKVDSRSDTKMSPSDTSSSNTPLKQQGGSSTLRFAGSLALSKGRNSVSPTTNNVVAVTTPTNVSIPRPYQPLSSGDFQYNQMLHNRAASGTILGSAVTTRVVDSVRVPYLSQPYVNPTMVTEDQIEEDINGSTSVTQSSSEDDLPVGPDRPTKALNEIWSACWDDEAGAVYYYNHVSGEATWILPDTSPTAS